MTHEPAHHHEPVSEPGVFREDYEDLGPAVDVTRNARGQAAEGNRGRT